MEKKAKDYGDVPVYDVRVDREAALKEWKRANEHKGSKYIQKKYYAINFSNTGNGSNA